MSWSKYAVGKSKTAQAQVEKMETPTHLRGAELDVYEAGKETILTALEAFSPDVIVSVTYNGHQDSRGYGQLEIIVKPLYDLRHEPASSNAESLTYP